MRNYCPISWRAVKAKIWSLGFILCVCFIALGGLGVAFYFSYADAWRLQELQNQWTGFGKEKGDYSFTVVTGLFDIGRGSWWTQTRSYYKYLTYLIEILKLDVNLIIFIEPKGIPLVQWFRSGRDKRTEIILSEIKDLEYYPLLRRITDIMNNESYQENNINYEKGKCEGTDPLYNLVTNSKITLVHEAITRNPFKSSYFIWMDGGYGHGDSSIYPLNGVWIPRHLLAYPDKVSFVSLRNLSVEEEQMIEDLHKKDVAWIAGGLFAAGTEAMEKFYDLHTKVIHEYMIEGKIDDDQTTFADCYFRQPSLFRPVQGSWFDLMKPFSQQARTQRFQ